MGATSNTPTSSGRLCANPLSVTFTSVMVPESPATVIPDGYGVAVPVVGMVITPELEGVAVSAAAESAATTPIASPATDRVRASARRVIVRLRCLFMAGPRPRRSPRGVRGSNLGHGELRSQ